MSETLQPEEIDFEAVLARLAPPTVPSAALANFPETSRLIEDLDPIVTVATLAGLQTEPAFQANLVRLEWAIRLVLALARGQRKPSRRSLHHILNVALTKARVNVLEDPIEDFLVERVPTLDGDFLLLSGTWEQAGFYTETVLSAFARLPDGESKRKALHWSRLLLRLSDALVRRADLKCRQIGGGDPKGHMRLPESSKLRSLAERAIFKWDELGALGFQRPDLYPFTLPKNRTSELLDTVPGNSVLDFKPLIVLPDGILVASPTNITTAIRALLIDAALKVGMGEELQRQLLETQAEAVFDSGFARLENFPVRRVGRYWLRGFGREVSSGRFVNYIQTIDNFDGWPNSAFGDVRDQPDLADAIMEGTRAAKAECEKRANFVEGLTVCLLGGWGAGRSLEIPNDPDLAEWEFVFLSPGDACAIARCEGGTVRDLWRLRKQQSLIEEQGFELFEINGLLNLFHWWRLTDHALVPPSWTDISPPAMVTMGTNHLLEARREGFESLDRRALPHPDGTHRIVTRLDPKDYIGDLLPIYGSLDDVRRGKLVAAVVSGPLVFWIHLSCESDDPRSYEKYETWKAALHWAELVVPAFQRSHIDQITAGRAAATLDIDWPSTFVERPIGDDEIPSTVAIDLDEDGRPRITLKPEWQLALRRPDNVAEVELAAALLRTLAQSLGMDVPIAELRAFVLHVAGSRDVRWRHMFVASRAIDMLKYHGLVERMREIPISAGALMKCGMAFLVNSREAGLKIKGKKECCDFISRLAATLTDQLCRRLATFDKESCLILALNSLQAAQGELRAWDFTARANRAIHGVREDHRGSLERVNKANGVVRSASMLIEIASAQAQSKDGRPLGDMDFAELQAVSLLIFQISDLVPTIMGDWVEPEIVISPTGDVLTNHDFEEGTLQKSAERRHEAERVRQSDSYDSRFAAEKTPSALPEGFGAAVAAEYGADLEAVLDLSYAMARIAGNTGSGVFIMARNDVINALEAFDGMEGQSLGGLIDRLTMPVRASWDEIPAGRSKSDFDISRFDRPLSLIARPIVAASEGPNPRLIVAPAVIERSILHNLNGALSGALQNEFWTTKEMRTFSSASGMRTGLEFNEIVAARVREVNFRTWASAKPAWALNRKATAEVERLGDIDVLAVSQDGAQVWVIEAKDLKLCRTMGEIARRLSDYRGRQNEKGHPDKMLRHLRRVAYLRDHATELARQLKLPAIPLISGLLVVRSPQPMEHVPGDSVDARVVMFDDIHAVLLT